jgi:uncharacterized membrane protein YfcA
VIELALVGLAAGVVSGLFGVGGGILFVPALVLVSGLGQVEAEATSLLAMIPVAVVGAWRQRTYGNLRLKAGLGLGVLAAAGTVAGVAIANAVPERGLEIGFACVQLVMAYGLVRSALRQRRSS